MKSVMIATPCYGGQVTTEYLNSITHLMVQATVEGLRVGLTTQAGESLITRSRNDLVRDFLEREEFTHLLFIDADLGFSYNHFKRLYDANYDVCAQVYPIKTIKWDNLVDKKCESMEDVLRSTVNVVVNQPKERNSLGFAAVQDAGTGFMMISRAALEKMCSEYPDQKYISDPRRGEKKETFNFFDTMVEGERYLSEDYAFCRRWQNIGGEVYADLSSELLGHQGYYVYGRIQ